MGINTGALYIILILFVIVGMAYIVSGPAPSQTPILTGPEVAVNQNNKNKKQAVLQLYNFTGATITPPVTSLCKKGSANVHPEALIAFTPSQASAVSTGGQISLWVSDTKPPYIAPNELVVNSTGAIAVPGDVLSTTSPGYISDGYLFEPQLYIFPQTLEKGGKYYFPDYVRGAYFNGTPEVSDNTDVLPPDSLPTSSQTAEYLWNVQSIGLTDGDYNIEYVAHGGHGNLGVKCVSLRVYTPPVTPVSEGG
jgi:hypothetical protein